MKSSKDRTPKSRKGPNLKPPTDRLSQQEFQSWSLGLVWILVVGSWCFAAGCRSNSSVSENPALTTNSELVQSCLLCHSTREMQRGPVIAGLPAWYQENQLRKFLDGTRGKNPKNKSEYLMGSGVSLIRSEDDLRAIAHFFSSLPNTNHIKTIRGNNQRGAEIYQNCIACHGISGEGRPDLKSPPLTVQEDWYLYDQMVRFRSGLRGSDERDTEGWLMHLSTQGMNSQDFRDVISFINDELTTWTPPSE